MTTVDIKRAKEVADNMEYISKFPSSPHGIDEAASLLRSLCEIVEKLPKDVIDNLPIHGTIQHAISDQHNRE